jgi:threonine dehydrogenase-like Zn-dependent dehydrogenase
MNNMMKSIAITPSHELRAVDVFLSSLKNDEILVKTLRTGICSTERELFHQKINSPEGDDFLILCHEAVGEVAETGSAVSQFQKGDIVVPSVRRGCGECVFCNNNRSDMCNTGRYTERGILKLHGFMSEYFIEQDKNLTKIPQALKSQAVLLEPLTIGIKALEEYYKVQKSRLCITKDISDKDILRNALIIGAGPIGLLTAVILACDNIPFVCADIDEDGGIKSEIIRSLNGQYINLLEYLDGDILNYRKLGREKTVGEIDLIVDASPDPATCMQMIDLLCFNGAIVHLGLPAENKERRMSFLDHYITSLVLKNGVILGSVNANFANFKTGITYMEQCQNKFGNVLDKIITHRFHFTDYQRAFAVKPKDRIKVVLEWS